MSALAAALAVALVATIALALLDRRRAAARLARAAAQLDPGAAPTASLGAAVGQVDQVVDAALQRDAAVEQSEHRLSQALASLPQGIVVYDPDGTVSFSNDVAAEFLTSRHGEALVEEAIAELAEAALGPARSEPEVATRTLELFGPPRRVLVLRAVPLEVAQGGGERVGLLVVIDDISERRRLEAIRRDFVANISHELKTPVGALGLLAETLLAEEDPAVVRRLAERLLAEADRVGRTIDDLLVLSRIEAGEDGMRDEVPVHVCIAEAVERVRPAAEQAGIELRVSEPPTRLAVLGDRRQLVSALYNLLDNAVKYSDPGSSVEVRARTDGRWVDLAVEDHGLGIPRRDLERVFERFYRVDRARSRETGGTGLGLAIVRHVVSNHAGEVRVDSQEGEGSTFTLRLPVGAGPVAVSAEAG